jgi:glycosyltransferase involved in cell wall biosynthesis
MPILESMATGVIVAGTDCTAIGELLRKGNGFQIPYDYTIRDPFGNGRRYYAQRLAGSMLLQELYDKKNTHSLQMIRDEAREYVESRTWETAVDQLDNAIKEIIENG